MHYSRNSPVGTQPRYYASTAVLLVEVIKLLASLVLATRDSCSSHPGARVSDVVKHLCRSIFAPDSWKLTVPAALYTLQNSLVYAAISNLDAVTFQVTYQLKILTTVLFSILLLGRSISLRQWLSLILLTLGVALVQVSGEETAEGWLERFTSVVRNGTMPTSSAFKGLMAVVAASLISGLTCVYFEKLVKDSMASVSLWTRNVQLSFFSLFPAFFIGVLWQDGAAIAKDGFFAGYNPIVWATIGLQALGGLIVAVCIAYADNVAKNFAASLSIVVSYAATVVIFGTPMSLHVGCLCSQLILAEVQVAYSVTQATVGALTVVLAMYIFNNMKPGPRMLLPVSQERHTSEMSNPLLAELTMPGHDRKHQSQQ